MKFSYQFQQLCGTVYTGGQIAFTEDGGCLLSPVGNRVTVFDLVRHTARTLPFENRCNIRTLAVSPDSRLLMTFDEEGRSLLINFRRKVVLHRFKFKKPVDVVKFSPDGAFIAVSQGPHIQVWRTPNAKRQFSPFVLHRTYTGHHDDVVSIQWSEDSRFILTGSKDLTARIYSRDPIKGFKPITLGGHRGSVVGAFFGYRTNEVYTVSKDGACVVWGFEEREGAKRHDDMEEESSGEEEEGAAAEDEQTSTADIPVLGRGVRFFIKDKHYFSQDHAKVQSISYHGPTGLLVAGFDSGVFCLYEMPHCSLIHSLSISQRSIDTAIVSPGGDWLAFGSARLGQLLVWEWQSETYVMKQQGHFFDVNCLAYSGDGQAIATGGEDGKIKLWNTGNGFCFATFAEHTAPIAALTFTSGHSQAVISASLDGTVRAFDLARYRNFRTMTTPQPVQFMSLAVDGGGEIICAGSSDPYNIFVWSLRTGRLLDALSGHEGPVVSLAFNPAQSQLASASWDKTVRLWDVYQNRLIETLNHSSEVLAVAFRPDGKQLCAATLDGHLSFWDVEDGVIQGTIDGRRDIVGGRKEGDRVAATANAASKHFTSVCYSADGSCVIAGGRSKFVCIYETSQRLLLKKFQISHNRSLAGVLDYLHSGRMTEAGTLDSLDVDDSEENRETRDAELLPGAKRSTDPGARHRNVEVLTKAVQFAPSGRSWAAASTEGLLLYSLDDDLLFDPIELDEEITPDTIEIALAERQFAKAIMMSLHLNESKIVKKTVESVPMGDIPLVADSIKSGYVARLLKILAEMLADSPHIDFSLLWCRHFMESHGELLQKQRGDFLPTFRDLQRALLRLQDNVSKLCNDNQYALDFLSAVPQDRAKPMELVSSS